MIYNVSRVMTSTYVSCPVALNTIANQRAEQKRRIGVNPVHPSCPVDSNPCPHELGGVSFEHEPKTQTCFFFFLHGRGRQSIPFLRECSVGLVVRRSVNRPVDVLFQF